MTKRVGTCDYMSPEVAKSNDTGPYTSAVDIWAVGIIAYEMLFGTLPFLAETEMGRLARIMNDDVYFPSFVDADMASFISAALTKDCSMRPSAMELLRFPWLTKDNNDIASSVVYFEALMNKKGISRCREDSN